MEWEALRVVTVLGNTEHRTPSTAVTIQCWRDWNMCREGVRTLGRY